MVRIKPYARRSRQAQYAIASASWLFWIRGLSKDSANFYLKSCERAQYWYSEMERIAYAS
jgi:hypothetical protein